MSPDRPGDAGDTPIDVLLVDDNAQWAEFMAEEIERATADIQVTVAGSANQVMLRLAESERLDCIVTDYQMPEVDGLQLLERVREDHPDLPFLLVTGEGSEDVAMRAIEAGVTDYLVKDPRTDQTPLFVNKIRTAVEQYRLQQALVDSEERYRLVTEQSRDGIGIVQRGDLVFGNERLAELTGKDHDSLPERLSSVVHPDDREQVGQVIERWADGETDQSLHEAQIVQDDGTVRHCEYTGCGITYDGEPATLVSIRDITERKRRERELQWERDLNRTVQEALVTARTRAELEAAVADQLQEYGYALVWLAEQAGESLSPRVVRGEDGYIEGIDRSLAGDTDSEPSIWAARSDAPQFVSDFESLFPTAWRETALDCGFRSGAVVPLVYDGITYGLVAVYHREPGRFDETEQRLLTELADTVAFAIHSIETENALATEQTVAVTVEIDDRNYYLVDLARDGAFLDCEVRVRGTVPDDEEGVRQYLVVDGGSVETIRERLSEHAHVRDVVVIDEGEPARLQVTVSEAVPERRIAGGGLVVRSTTIGASGATITVEAPTKAAVNAQLDRLEAASGSTSVRSVQKQPRGESHGPRSALGTGELTAKQATALEAAFHHGYFEKPRQSSASDIADSLDVAHSTFLQHLRAAQQKLFAQQFT